MIPHYLSIGSAVQPIIWNPGMTAKCRFTANTGFFVKASEKDRPERPAARHRPVIVGRLR